MTPVCQTCSEPVLLARTAGGDGEIALQIEPTASRRILAGQTVRVVVDGFAWQLTNIVAAIAIETSVAEYPDALLRAVKELDWHLAHVCAREVPVPA